MDLGAWTPLTLRPWTLGDQGISVNDNVNPFNIMRYIYTHLMSILIILIGLMLSLTLIITPPGGATESVRIPRAFLQLLLQTIRKRRFYIFFFEVLLRRFR